MADCLEPGSWNVDMEVNLFHAMRGHKPVGVNRHFQMVFIHDKLINASNKKLTAKNIWDHLSSMYDLQALNESEILPFPNKNIDFQLPDPDFEDLRQKDFPRMGNTENQLLEEEVKTKAEGQSKVGNIVKTESKTMPSIKLDGQTLVHQLEPKSVSSIRSDSKTMTMPLPESKTIHSSKSADNKTTLLTSEPKSTHIFKSIDNKTTLLTSETKCSYTSKSEIKTGSSLLGRGEGKGGGKTSQATTGLTSTPDPSPKRTKRTRNNQSASSSPATPSDIPAAKRRR